MEDLFSKLAIQAVTIVGKAAFGMAVNQAVRQLKEYGPKVIKKSSSSNQINAKATTDREGKEGQDELSQEFARLDELRSKLQQKIAILTPTIDMIHVVCAKSTNIGLEAILTMANDLNQEMDSLSSFLGVLESNESSSNPNETMSLAQVRSVTQRVKRILDKIEDAVPYINLALSVSGVKLGGISHGSKGSSVSSLSLLLNASSQMQRAAQNEDSVPLLFPCRVYRLFDASIRANGAPNWTWKLEHLSSILRVVHRTPNPEEEDESMSMIRVEPYRFDDPNEPPEEESPLQFNLSDLKAMYFTATGRLLNIPDSNPGAPVLVLQLKEYMAIEILTPEDIADTPDSDSEEETDEERAPSQRKKSAAMNPAAQITANLAAGKEEICHQLALLETLLRLVAVERALGTSHLNVSDDLLAVYLSSNQTPSSLADAPVLNSPPPIPASSHPTSPLALRTKAPKSAAPGAFDASPRLATGTKSSSPTSPLLPWALMGILALVGLRFLMSLFS